MSEKIEYVASGSTYWDGVTTRMYQKKSVTLEEAVRLLERHSERANLWYEALDALRYLRKDMTGAQLHGYVNFVVFTMIAAFGNEAHREMCERRADHYRAELEKLGFDLDHLFYDEYDGEEFMTPEQHEWRKRFLPGGERWQPDPEDDEEDD